MLPLKELDIKNWDKEFLKLILKKASKKGAFFVSSAIVFFEAQMYFPSNTDSPAMHYKSALASLPYGLFIAVGAKNKG
ncbi:hypothetical protein [Pedobacter sp.]|uniref:hypothetical protein n=1 Tax=Pedobacter sp. TaxID=1411316 RepID=UPI0031E396EB